MSNLKNRGKNWGQGQILNDLSQVEHSHHEMLKGEHTMALEFEDYGEQDIEKAVT